jgi:hypothetical protein
MSSACRVHKQCIQSAYETLEGMGSPTPPSWLMDCMGGQKWAKVAKVGKSGKTVQQWENWAKVGKSGQKWQKWAKVAKLGKSGKSGKTEQSACSMHAECMRSVCRVQKQSDGFGASVSHGHLSVLEMLRI